MFVFQLVKENGIFSKIFLHLCRFSIKEKKMIETKQGKPYNCNLDFPIVGHDIAGSFI
jgi:uncharacterized protein YjhX (UPF0386 family)